VSTTVGYTGGTTAAPDYRSMGDHSEAVRVEFDPQQISYARLLQVFWDSHDSGDAVYSRQYRKAIFFLNERQLQEAEASRERIAAASPDRVTTTLEPAGEFFVAEDYHQKYLLRKARGMVDELQVIYPEPAAFAVSTAAARINGYLGCNGEQEALMRDLDRLGLSAQMQARLVEHVASSCARFAGLTCPARY